jgi:hypothetical protein
MVGPSGIVAEVCHELELTGWLDVREPRNRHHVRVGKATVTLALNGLGFRNRLMYAVLQRFARKLLNLVRGPGISARMLTDDDMGRT